MRAWWEQKPGDERKSAPAHHALLSRPGNPEAISVPARPDTVQFAVSSGKIVLMRRCHVEYHFKGEGKLVTYPWSQGLKIEDHYKLQQGSFSRLDHAETDAQLQAARIPGEAIDYTRALTAPPSR